jgi:nucleoside-diphosphate-sugar epimerase
VSERPWLVTGASGFVGRHLLTAQAETEAPRPVLALLRQPEEWTRQDWTAQLRQVAPVQGSLRDSERWAPGLPRLGGIFHLAAVVRHSRREPEDMVATNVEGTLAMVRLAARHACRLVVMSTSGTVGCSRSREVRADENAPHCDDVVAGWPYYRSKIELERRARRLADELGVELVLIRAPILLGPGDHRFRSTSNVLKGIRRKMPFIIQGGMHFADVRDAADALLRVMAHPAPRPIYHLEGTECGIEDFFAMIEEASGVPRPRLVLPYRIAWLAATALERFHVVPDPVVVEMASHWWGARSLYAADDLGYKSRDPRETLRDTVDWLRAHAPD